MLKRSVIQRVPELQTARLLLRGFGAADAPRLAKLAGSRGISDTMISVPYPFDTEHARIEIERYEAESCAGAGYHFAITLRENRLEFIGYIALKHIDREHLETELSFWINSNHTGRGYMTEAGLVITAYAFEYLSLNRVCAYHMRR
ncbi:MAG: GNAT family N-acetyltransferase, partial [Stenotrophobium sp.]